jgi:uncharacterized protein (DUF2235 family)
MPIPDQESKNIVICCDGTGDQFGVHNSNVIKLFAMLESMSSKQILYYHPGVGTKSSLEPPGYLGTLSQKLKNWHAFAFGYGMISNLANAYSFLMDTYRPGDRIFLVGFSRGAFTVRALSSLIHEFGLLDRGCHALITYMLHLFFKGEPGDGEISQSFRGVFGRPCDVHFVGVWDTVDSVGWIYSPLKVPFESSNPSIRIGRQALAIDENRCLFTPNLWEPAGAGQDFKQVWFAGAHSDVGGGYEQAGLANIALHWMSQEIDAAGVIFDQAGRKRVLLENLPNPADIRHHPLKGLWWIPELLPQGLRPGSPPLRGGRKWEFHLGQPRFIPEGSLIHESVRERMQNTGLSYSPVNLPQHFQYVP